MFETQLLSCVTILSIFFMQNAKYFCTGTLPDDADYHHFALSVPLYTHFTSPIRRYPDVMVHRLLAASLGQFTAFIVVWVSVLLIDKSIIVVNRFGYLYIT